MKIKEKIIELRKLGYSYNKIVKELGCSKSTVSFHCINEKLSEPVSKYKKITNEIIENIKNDSILTIKEISKKYNISEGTVKKYKKYKYKKKNCKNCKNCGIEIKQNKFCSNDCSNEYKHKEAYNNYLINNEKYCKGNYTPKQFKDLFLIEQNNKCSICGIEPEWMNKKLVFVIDHIDGDCSNNSRENIRMICPNCDSQTSTFKSKNKNSKRRNYWKEKIISDINKNNGNVLKLD